MVTDPDAQAPPGFGRLGEEAVFSGHVFKVVQAHFTDPDGRPFDRSVVRHPGAVAVVAVDTDGTSTLVRQLRAAVYNSPGYSDQRTQIYLATGLRSCATGRDGVEERWMTTERVALGDAVNLLLHRTGVGVDKN